jgi:hypothetical protein
MSKKSVWLPEGGWSAPRTERERAVRAVMAGLVLGFVLSLVARRERI